MLAQLIETVKSLGSSATFVFIIDQFESGIVLRFGIVQRQVGAGLHWKIPFIEKMLKTSLAVDTHECKSQTLTTSDGVEVTVTPVAKYRISNAEKYLMKVENPDTFLNDFIACAVKGRISEVDYRELLRHCDAIEQDINMSLQKEVRPYGYRIEKISLVTVARIKAIRVIFDGPV